MTYLHFLTDENGNQTETVYSNNSTLRLSLECSSKIKNEVYKIWNKETNEVTTIEV